MSVVIIKFCFYLKRKRKQRDTEIRIQIPENKWLFVFLNPYLTVEAPTLFLRVWPLSVLPHLSSLLSALLGETVTLMWQWKYLLRFCVYVCSERPFRQENKTTEKALLQTTVIRPVLWEGHRFSRQLARCTALHWRVCCCSD